MVLIISIAVFVFYMVALFLWSTTGWSTKHEDKEEQV